MTFEELQLPSDSKKLVRDVLDSAHAAKIIKIAERGPTGQGFPHITRKDELEYVYYPFEWWTSGFFPGSIWALYERSCKVGKPSQHLLELAKRWSHTLEPHKKTTTTHDLGFLIMPSYNREYDLTKDKKSAEVIVETADTLLTRWCEKAQAIRSWDRTATENYEFSNLQCDILVIIDNMMNLDLLYKASIITGDKKYADIATRHAETTSKYHIRRDYSTYHVVVYDAVSGKRKIGITNQGYDHESCWSRGQAWALYGYATVYQFTKDKKYLELSKKLADYFLSRTENGVVYWDFDAPRPCAWDVSASVIAASGMLLLCQLENNDHYLTPALTLLKTVLKSAVSPPEGDLILTKSTIANYKYHRDPLTNHGLVYADYYFIEAGNRLIDMGLVKNINSILI